MGTIGRFFRALAAKLRLALTSPYDQYHDQRILEQGAIDDLKKRK